MAYFNRAIICRCGRILNDKHIKFRKLLIEKKMDGLQTDDNSDLAKKLNLKDKCCKITVLTTTPNPLMIRYIQIYS